MHISTDSPALSPTVTTSTHDYEYYKKVFAGHTLPLAYLDLDLLEQNIQQIISRAGGKRIRIASKSIRSVEVLRRILAADPCFQGSCALRPAKPSIWRPWDFRICSSAIPPGTPKIFRRSPGPSRKVRRSP
ncbi:hypothetical protein [Dictyobacter vulcani]|uniref:hypothetical protein n=1 Tax=Dictyobacter vulcani TaxID=2607529 RepID=UPI001E449C7F|nr:hypothetical protein [Dictyobacter vulcani]